MMLEANYALYRLGFVLLDELTDSVKVTFRNTSKTALPNEEKSAMKPSKREVQSVKFKQTLENAPSCPCCGAMTDNYGHSFASKIVVDGVVYYCNNPVCNGGRYHLTVGDDSSAQESGASAQ